MRVFVTGATGFIGRAVVHELIGAGHEVVGLARSDAAAQALAQAVAAAHPGSIDDPDSVRRGAEAADGVVHLAFNHDFSQYLQAGETDRRVVEAFGEALAGSGKPLVTTSGSAIVPLGRLGTEEDAADPASPASVRLPSERAVEAMAGRGVRATIVRPAPSVHGDGDTAFVPAMIGVARDKGVSAYVGDGTNRWPAVHRLDAARLYRLALEKGEAGARYHAVAEQGIPVREVAEAIGRKLGIPSRSISADEAEAHFGWLAMFVGLDNPTSSALTQERLGWRPREVGLIEDLERGRYFEK